MVDVSFLSDIESTVALQRTIHSRFSIARSSGVALLAVVSLVLSVRWLDQHYHLKDWLAWTLATIWGWQAVLAVCVTWFGNAVIVQWLGIRPRSLSEALALAVPTGVMAFAMGMFVAGFLGLFVHRQDTVTHEGQDFV